MLSRQLLTPTNTSLSEWTVTRSICKPSRWNTSLEHHGRQPQGPLSQLQTSDKHLLGAAYCDKMTKPVPHYSKDHPWVLKLCIKCYAQTGVQLSGRAFAQNM